MTARKMTPSKKPGVDIKVVGDEVVCQTSKGELRLPLDLPFEVTMELARMQDDSTNELTAFYRAVEAMPADVKLALNAMGTREVMQILPRWMNEFGTMIKADLGESQGSSV